MGQYQQLIDKLKKQIIEELTLEHLKPSDINADVPLFGEGLGLDSIDALVLIVLLEKNYGLKITDETEGKKILYSVNSIAEYIIKNQ